jgi:hypothetical protein
MFVVDALFIGCFFMIRGFPMVHVRQYFVISGQTTKAVQYCLPLGLDCMHTKLQVNIFKTGALMHFQSRHLKNVKNDLQFGLDLRIPNLLCMLLLLCTVYIQTKFEVNRSEFGEVMNF